MVNVTCATINVNIDSLIPTMVVKALFNAIPVTMPGKAIGRMTSILIALLPKKSYRCNASAHSVPRINETMVATIATPKLVSAALSNPAEWNALPHHSNVTERTGHAKVASPFTELISTTASGA